MRIDRNQPVVSISRFVHPRVDGGALPAIVAKTLGRSGRIVQDWGDKSNCGRKQSALQSRPALGTKPKRSPARQQRLLKLRERGPETSGTGQLWTVPKVVRRIADEFGATYNVERVPTTLLSRDGRT